MLITNGFFKYDNCCSSIIKFLLEDQNKTNIELNPHFKKDNYFSWFNDNITYSMTYKQRIQYAIFAAKLVLPLFEKEHPNDNRPRQAIEAAKKCIKDPSAKNRSLASAGYYDSSIAANKGLYNLDSSISSRSAADAARYASISAYYISSIVAKPLFVKNFPNNDYDFDFVKAATKSATRSVSYASRSAAIMNNKEIENKIMKYGLELLTE